MRLGDLVEHLACNSSCSRREPRDKCDPVGLAVIHDIVPLTISETVSVLNRDDGNDLARSLDMLLRNVRQRDQANLTRASELSQGFNGSIEINYWIRSV